MILSDDDDHHIDDDNDDDNDNDVAVVVDDDEDGDDDYDFFLPLYQSGKRRSSVTSELKPPAKWIEIAVLTEQGSQVTWCAFSPLR